MSAQDLEQRTLELLPELPPMAMTITGDDPDAGHWYRADQMRGYAIRAIAAALRQQPAPTDLEQFREAVECWHDAALPANDVEAERKAKAKRLLSIIDNAGKMEVLARGWFHRLPDGDYDIHDEASGAGKDCDGCTPCLIVSQDHAHQPAPVVDDARMAHALEWVRVMAMQDADGSHVPAIEEAIAAYDPNCGARTVRVVDDAMVERLARAWCDQTDTGFDALPEAGRQLCLHHMRIALTAALARTQEVQP